MIGAKNRGGASSGGGVIQSKHTGEKMPLAIKFTENILEISLPPSKDRSLLRWALATKAAFFTEVFGLNVELN